MTLIGEGPGGTGPTDFFTGDPNPYFQKLSLVDPHQDTSYTTQGLH
jgi:hypothetical protein